MKRRTPNKSPLPRRLQRRPRRKRFHRPALKFSPAVLNQEKQLMTRPSIKFDTVLAQFQFPKLATPLKTLFLQEFEAGAV
ncbi:hypothetical protein Pan54_04780 [Rubinisphaera italica]|uniref:Uncharacterized protein n=1 Tax=Rubinisphaera italica TaxID=2527969 RepID=A0A5C5XAG3_9PLAN|nr:hypothetical protein Pan54_04780 [Rubinisphaera italica]